jgi:hypothetical protein
MNFDLTLKKSSENFGLLQIKINFRKHYLKQKNNLFNYRISLFLILNNTIRNKLNLNFQFTLLLNIYNFEIIRIHITDDTCIYD